MKKNLRTPGHISRRKKSRLSLSRVFALLAASVLLIGLGTVVFSQSGQKNQPPARDNTPAPVKNGKKYVATKEIIFDQESGKLRKPTADETQALVNHVSALTNRSSEGLTVNQHPNGMKSMSLEGRFSGVALGRANADGSTEVRCVFTMEEAAEFLGLEEATSQE